MATQLLLMLTEHLSSVDEMIKMVHAIFSSVLMQVTAVLFFVLSNLLDV